MTTCGQHCVCSSCPARLQWIDKSQKYQHFQFQVAWHLGLAALRLQVGCWLSLCDHGCTWMWSLAFFRLYCLILRSFFLKCSILTCYCLFLGNALQIIMYSSTSYLRNVVVKKMIALFYSIIPLVYHTQLFTEVIIKMFIGPTVAFIDIIT